MLWRLLLLLAFANGAPVVATKLLHRHFSRPIDGGMTLRDGRPLFGASKTVRGVALSLLVTSAAAPLLGFTWHIGLAVAAAAMSGDLLSSFVKRRLRLPSGSRSTGLDQVPESILPLLACRRLLSLTGSDIVTVAALFFAGEVLLSRVLYRWHVRDRPY